jgi:hypothetical protein
VRHLRVILCLCVCLYGARVRMCTGVRRIRKSAIARQGLGMPINTRGDPQKQHREKDEEEDSTEWSHYFIILFRE